MVTRKKSITYYTNKTSETWSHESLSRGVGGSQTAVIHLSRLWAKMGFEVTVFCNLNIAEGIYDGVHYRHYKYFDPADKMDILIIWRDLDILDQNLNAHLIYLDLHDIPEHDDFTQERLKKLDKIFVKSQYHKELLPDVKTEIVIIPNGVDIECFSSKNEGRDYNRLIYASDYFRGLEPMLRYGWNIIKKRIPDAELDIFYGWNFFDAVWKDNEEKQAWKHMMINLMNQPGVRERGRVGQVVLASNLKMANILYYGTTFKEIDCITVRQAAVAGCIPCTTDYGALAQKLYSIKTHGDPFDKNTQISLANTIADLMLKATTPNSRIEQKRRKFQSIAQKESWSHTARKWSHFFKYR